MKAAALLAATLALSSCHRPPPPRDPGPVRWLKGQLHAHTSESGDSHTPPEDAVRWYEAHGFDFVVFTDHNHVTVAKSTPRLLAIPGVELTANAVVCGPAPEPGYHCAMHMNGLFVDPAKAEEHYLFPAQGSREGLYAEELERVRSLGGLAQLNHPNFQYMADAGLIAKLVGSGVALLEVHNESGDVNAQGDATHPSTEALWDAVLSSGVKVFATATDDAHHYFDAEEAASNSEAVFTGDRGFVMVRSTAEPNAIREAMTRGDFYASSGVKLATLEVKDGALHVAASPETPARRITFIGRGGEKLLVVEDNEASFPLAKAKGGYVRARLADAKGNHAWTQPLFVP